MKKKLVGILAIAGMMMLSGCKSMPITQYDAPKSNVASSAITGNSLTVKYMVDNSGQPSTLYNHEYFIYSRGSSKLLATSYPFKYYTKAPAIKDLFRIPTLASYIYGTIGDKVVYTFSNGLGPVSPLAVYDHSERRSYFLTKGDEEYIFLKRGTSYVVKLLKQKKYIALNNLKEVKIDESKYRALTMKFVSSNRYRTPKPTSVMKSHVIGSFVGMTDNYPHRLPPFLFGPNLQRVSKNYGDSLRR